MVLHQKFLIFRLGILLRGFKLFDTRKGSLVHGRHEDLTCVTVVGRNRRHHVGDDDALDVSAIAKRIFHSQDATPRVAEQEEVGVVQAQGNSHLLDLIDEAVEIPQRRVGGLVTSVRPELVVLDHLDARGDETGGEALEVLR